MRMEAIDDLDRVILHTSKNKNTKMWMVRVSTTPMNKPLPKQGFYLKVSEAIRTPDIHVGVVQPRRSEDIVRANLLRWWQGCH